MKYFFVRYNIRMSHPESLSIYERELARQEREIVRLEEQLKLVKRECSECEDTEMCNKLQAKLEELQTKLNHYTDTAA